jgi:hypothetical protein
VYIGRDIAQAVSRWLPTAAARVKAQVRSCGICGGQSGTVASFPRVLRFPLPILIPPTASHSSSSSIFRDWYNRPVSDRRTKWTQFHPTNNNKCTIRCPQSSEPRKSKLISVFISQTFQSRKPKLTAVGIRCADHATPSIS